MCMPMFFNPGDAQKWWGEQQTLEKKLTPKFQALGVSNFSLNNLYNPSAQADWKAQAIAAPLKKQMDTLLTEGAKKNLAPDAADAAMKAARRMSVSKGLLGNSLLTMGPQSTAPKSILGGY